MVVVGTEPATFMVSDACTASEVRHMKGRLSLVTRMGVVLTLQMAMAGCVTGGGGGVFGFIDGDGFLGGGSSAGSDGGSSGESGGVPESLSSLPLGGGDSGSEGSSSTGPVIASSPVTVHNPEPASMALFGGGLAGLAALRRRKARRI